MKKSLITIILLGLSFFGFGQYYNFPFGSPDSVVCPLDSSKMLYLSEFWEPYFTLNDALDGPIDSTICIGFSKKVQNNYTFYCIYQEDIPVGRTLYVRFKIADSNAYPLYPNRVSFLSSSIFQWDFCGNTVCTELIIHTRIPDSTGTGFFHRQYEFGPPKFELCFVSEKFQQQWISFIAHKIGRGIGTGFIYGWGLTLNTYHYYNVIPQSNSVTFNGSNYVANFYDGFIAHHGSSWPSEQNISYTEFYPADQPDTAVQIFIPNWRHNFFFQPYTAIRGGLVSPTDSLRHGINLTIDGEACYSVGDLIWEQKDEVVAMGGTFYFKDDFSCNSFGKGATLRVASGFRFEYGHHSRGMLALRTGAKVIIEPGAELFFQGKLVMMEYESDPGPQQLFMDLPKGAKLTFGPGARATNEFSKDGTMRLNVRMLGGELDLSGLPSQERWLVNPIYESPSANPQKNLQVFPNPVQNGRLEFFWIADQQDEPLTFRLLGYDGKIWDSWKSATQNPGHNHFERSLDGLPQGVFMLEVTSPAGKAVSRIARF